MKLKTRAFLAFDVSEEVVRSLAEAGEELRKTGADVGVVTKENLHFTVKFLGEIPETVVSEVDSRVGKLDLHAFEAEVKGIGVFPDPSRPRIVWAGVAAGAEEMIRSVRSVTGALAGLGKEEERDFQPHLTIGRVRSPRNSDELASFVARNSEREFGKTRIVRLKLKSSLLTPRGPVYTDVREYSLK